MRLEYVMFSHMSPIISSSNFTIYVFDNSDEENPLKAKRAISLTVSDAMATHVHVLLFLHCVLILLS